MAAISAESRTVARKGLLSAGLLGGIGLALSGTYALTGQGIPCPWRALTHTLCPFCGATTLGAALLNGDVSGAWAANPFVFLLLAGLAVACLFGVLVVAGGPGFRLAVRLREQRFWYAGLTVAAVVFAVGRNLL
jgi:hypothetical protein